jgi:hypothetical protein
MSLDKARGDRNYYSFSGNIIAKQKVNGKEHMKKMEMDTINGVYIPKDMEDCFNSLNLLLDKSEIESKKSLPNKVRTFVA